MLIAARTGSLAFKFWSPMSVGVWALLAFGVFAAGSFAEARWPHSAVGRALGGPLGRPFMLLGSALGRFIARYTGVLLSVSNQPVWRRTRAPRGRFLAPALSRPPP